jgi:hypothetical protein
MSLLLWLSKLIRKSVPEVEAMTSIVKSGQVIASFTFECSNQSLFLEITLVSVTPFPGVCVTKRILTITTKQKPKRMVHIISGGSNHKVNLKL